jgi:hypothetical protein
MNTKMLLTTTAIAVFAFGALADDGHQGNNNNNNNNNNNANSSFEASVIGSTPGQAVGGLLSAGAPWVVRSGDASVSSDGSMKVELKGLLLGTGAPANLIGTTGPVSMVAATLVCGGSGGTAIPVPDLSITPSVLSAAGNAEIRQAVTLPATCFAPSVLVRIFTATNALGSQLGPFIAVTGITPGAAQNNNNNNNNNNEDNHGGGHGN